MHGNVMEWCADRYNPGAYSGTPLPPEIEGSFLVLRGGSYNFPAGLSASGRRYRNLEQVTNDYIGFRVLLEIP
jgi:formylglycine-generating enzyme required for sulfatase activity